MKALWRFVLLVGVLRASLFLFSIWLLLWFPTESYHLESKMVGMAWRAQVGLSLYPDWKEGPHIANFFSPLYFLLVGWTGRLLDASLEQLFTIGRCVSIASVLAASLGLGRFIAKRYGWPAALLATVFSIGIAPQQSFTALTRPDALSVTLGLFGYLASLAGGGWLIASTFILVAAIMTKQTAVIYLIAAICLRMYRRQFRTAFAFFCGNLALLAALVFTVTWYFEPNFAADLIGEAGTAWDRVHWSEIMLRIAAQSPTTLVLPILGVAVALTGPSKDDALVVLSTVLLTLCTVATAKRGADVNYFLPIAAIEGWVVARAYALAWDATISRRLLSLASPLFVIVLCVPGLMYVGLVTLKAVDRTASFQSGSNRQIHFERARFMRLAADPKFPFLTDCGEIALRQHERAPFWDPWLFHMLVETGQIKPYRLSELIAKNHFRMILLTSDVRDPNSSRLPMSLPEPLAEQVRRRYIFADHRAGLFVYVPKPG